MAPEHPVRICSGVRFLAAIVAFASCALLVRPAGLAQDAASPAGAASPYDGAWEHARELEALGEHAAAAFALAELAQQYPDDYAVHLQRGYYLYEARLFDESLASYRLAYELSGGSLDAKLGLGFALAALERFDEAQAHFEAALAQSPDSRLAREGLALCRAQSYPRLVLGAGPVAHLYQDHPYLQSAVGVSVTARGRPLEWLGVGGLYRHTQFSLARAARARGDRWSAQHEAHFFAELSRPAFGVTLDYGFVLASSAPLDDAHVIGGIARYSPFGHITLEASASFYADQTVPRLVPAWSIPLSTHLFVRPAFGLQPTRDQLYFAPELSLFAVYDGAYVALLGRAGESFRPVWLEQPSIYNTTDLLAEGASASAGVALGEHLWLDLAYEIQRREVEVATASDSTTWIAYAHLGVLGLRFTP